MKEERITKSAAARSLGIARITVIRYAQKNLVSQNDKGRVLLSELKKVWSSPIKRKRSKTPRKMFVPRDFNDSHEVRANQFLKGLSLQFEKFLEKRSKMEKATDPKKADTLIKSLSSEQDSIRIVLCDELNIPESKVNKILSEETNSDWVWSYRKFIEERFLRIFEKKSAYRKDLLKIREGQLD